MTHLNDIDGATYFASYDFTTAGWRRTGIWRLEGKSENGMILYFISRSGTIQTRRAFDYCFIRTFKPFVMRGGKGR